MEITVNTGNAIDPADIDIAAIEATIRSRIARFENRITRAIVHLDDANADKGGADDKECTIETRPEGLDPVVASDRGSTIDVAVSGAAAKAANALDRAYGKLTDRKGH